MVKATKDDLPLVLAGGFPCEWDRPVPSGLTATGRVTPSNVYRVVLFASAYETGDNIPCPRVALYISRRGVNYELARPELTPIANGWQSAVNLRRPIVLEGGDYIYAKDDNVPTGDQNVVLAIGYVDVEMPAGAQLDVKHVRRG